MSEPAVIGTTATGEIRLVGGRSLSPNVINCLTIRRALSSYVGLRKGTVLAKNVEARRHDAQSEWVLDFEWEPGVGFQTGEEEQIIGFIKAYLTEHYQDF